MTFGALSGLWKFDQDQDDSIPLRAAVEARLPDVDYTALDVDAARRTAFLRRSGMRAHLGGVGKGYAIDRAAAILRARGFNDFMIQSGGDLFVSGRWGDRSWRVGIRDPRGAADRSFAALDLTNATVSTSGDYELFFLREGRRYHHILDPKTGLSSLFLDIPQTEFISGGEQGVLGLAFHPGYADNGRYFLHLVNADGNIEIREYARSANPNAGAVKTIIEVPHPVNQNHNGGTIVFGPNDGYLYVSIGDKTEDGKLVVRVWWKPWILCVWGGALVMIAGGLVSLSDRRLRVGAPSRRARSIGAMEAAE